jgi:hypothetical protein
MTVSWPCEHHEICCAGSLANERSTPTSQCRLNGEFGDRERSVHTSKQRLKTICGSELTEF